MGIADWVLKVLDPERVEAQLEATLQSLRARRKTRSAQLHELATAYSQEKLVLVLGAGVSQEYALPSWSVLLQALLIRSLSTQPEEDQTQTAAVAEIYTEIFKPNPLIAARYIRLNLPSDKFLETVRGILYSQMNDKDSPLMREIRNLAIAPGRAPNLDSIITFNFDDVLERSLGKVDIDVAFHVISDVEIRPKPGSLPIYHVHGYLPREGSISSTETIILSEDDYHARYSDIYNWSNIVQINKFRENTCLFIGLSFSDPNLRRLLDIAQKQRGDNQLQHFLIRKRYSVDDALAALVSLRKARQEPEGTETGSDQANSRTLAEKVVSLMEKFDELDANSFGATIIWVSDFSEVPGLLRDLYGKVTGPMPKPPSGPRSGEPQALL